MAKRDDLWVRHSGKLGESVYEKGLRNLKTTRELRFYLVLKFSTPHKLCASFDTTTADGRVMAVSTHFLLCTLPCWILPLQSLSFPGGMLRDSASCYFFFWAPWHINFHWNVWHSLPQICYNKVYVNPSSHRNCEWAQKANANVYAIG